MGLAKRLYSAFRIGGHFGDPMEDSSRLTSWQKAKEVLRIAYTLPFVLASIVGVVFALTTRTEPLISILIPITVLFLALFVALLLAAGHQKTRQHQTCHREVLDDFQHSVHGQTSCS